MTFASRITSRAPMEEDAARRLTVLGRAPELVGVDPWFNTADGEPLRLAALRDRVVLLEFWTFACVNCQRTLLFLRRMHDQYQPDFTVVGVHSPEFAFERSVQNVERAVRQHGLASIPSARTTTSSPGTRTETGTGRPCTSSIAPASFATRRSVRVITVRLKLPFARCSPKPAAPQPRQEQPLDEVRWLRTSGCGIGFGVSRRSGHSMSGPPVPAC